ncbi:MAG: tRNA cyclic N6-threonylcarbamoyladenosine(37) synthase TcdA [Kangiellaceae bacterium]
MTKICSFDEKITTPAFAGTSRLYGEMGMARLANMHVTIIGIGGVGSWSSEALVRTFVGNICLIDLDDICISNINRQIHTTTNSVGQLKVDAMKERLLSINPNCNIETKLDFVNKENLESLIPKQTDYVIDAIDNAKVKAHLIAYCKRNRIKIITTGGAGGQIDPLKVTCSDLNKSWQDPLSAKVRNELRRKFGFSRNPKRNYGVQCIYSTEQIRYPNANGEVSYAKQKDKNSNKLDCSQGLGASVMVTSSFGMMAAANVVNNLLSDIKPVD